MTIDQAISRLNALRACSPLGGDTVLVAGLPDRPFLRVQALLLESNDESALVVTTFNDEEVCNPFGILGGLT